MSSPCKTQLSFNGSAKKQKIKEYNRFIQPEEIDTVTLEDCIDEVDETCNSCINL